MKCRIYGLVNNSQFNLCQKYIHIQQSVLITKESKLRPMHFRICFVCTTIIHFLDRDVKVKKITI